MIVEWMIRLGGFIFDVIYAMLGVLPTLPEAGVNALDFIFDTMFAGVSLASIFIDFSFVKIVIPITIAILNFDHIIKFITYLLKKIPVLGIE